MTYATPADVAVALRGSTSFSTEEGVQWQAWLDTVERAIVRRFRRAGLDLFAQTVLEDPTAEDVADVEVDAVIRKHWHMKASAETLPGTSRTVSIDDGSVTNRNDGRAVADYNPLALTDDEWDSLLPSGDPAAFSTRPGFEPDHGPIFTDWS